MTTLTPTGRWTENPDGSWSPERTPASSSGGGVGPAGPAGPAGATGATGPSGAAPLTTKGDLLGYDTAATRVPVGADGTVLTADSTASLGVSYQAPAGALGALTPDVDLPLTTLTGWSVLSGTWSVTTNIHVANSASDCILLYDSRVGTALVIADIEFQVVSGTAAALQRASIGFARPSAGGNGWPLVHYQSQDSGTTWKVQADTYATAGHGPGPAIAGHTGYGVWRKMRVIKTGPQLMVIIDGNVVLDVTSMDSATATADRATLVISAVNTVVEFRNLKVYHASLANRLLTGV